MKDKYLISYKDQIHTFQTKKQIMDLFKVPLYIIDKIIKKSNNLDYKTKANCHSVYRDFYNELNITLIKPDI